MPYFVYVLRTSSNTLYIGQTNNLEKRIKEHKDRTSKSAKYMRYFKTFELVYFESYQTRTEAMQREYQLKRWPRAKKEAMIAGDFKTPKRIHVAIMKKSWGLTQKILMGEKTIESRWYKNRSKPWGQIFAGDTIYFKDSGEPVTLKARVAKVLQFADLTPQKTKRILKKYGRSDLGITKNIPPEIKNYFQNKKYCIFIFLDKVKKIKPFEIDKTGFGAMAAWLIVDDLAKIKKPVN